jgi:chromosome segregation ATPase
MDRRAKQIAEGSRDANDFSDKLEGLRKSHVELVAAIEQTERRKSEITRETAEFEKSVLAASGRYEEQLASLELTGQQIELVNERVADLGAGVRSAEDQLKLPTSRERQILKTAKKIDSLGSQIEELASRSETIRERVDTLPQAERRIQEILDLSEKAARELETVAAGREMVQSTADQVQQLQRAQTALNAQYEKLSEDREEVVKANRAIEEFRAANAEAEARAEVMTKRFDALDAAYSRFGELQSLSDSLDDR